MDVQNTQLGQGYAIAVPANAVPANAGPASADSSVPSSSKLQNGELERNAIAKGNEKPVSLLTNVENLRDTTQNLSQVSQEQSDIGVKSDDEGQLGEAATLVESFLQGENRNLAFSIDENTERSVVTVLDSDSGDVIRQIPSEEILVLAKRIQELQQDIGSSVGVLIDNQV
ncbi:flagellar protein FlaG [Alteromonas sp.]|uniref:flagellar protein FlaG n=1 Tax=Alteromonas sp. TaxID=232 RepID=UPI000C51661C|nr:flagellar protein FlaG [Alteromonas sp.]MBM88321.1 flagellar biosynthesis protein FlaG [Gammaproteobacteria bacterium]NQY17567.1 flagellar protein FlaG [Alteromonas sp.]